MAGGVALTDATILEHVRVVAGDPAQVAAHEAADRPAHGDVAALEVEQMLLGLVGRSDHRSGLRQRPVATWLDSKQSLERGDACAGAPPLVAAVPPEFGTNGLGHAPT